jgi:hypothetical protein
MKLTPIVYLLDEKFTIMPCIIKVNFSAEKKTKCKATKSLSSYMYYS